MNQRNTIRPIRIGIEWEDRKALADLSGVVSVVVVGVVVGVAAVMSGRDVAHGAGGAAGGPRVKPAPAAIISRRPAPCELRANRWRSRHLALMNERLRGHYVTICHFTAIALSAGSWRL